MNYIKFETVTFQETPAPHSQCPEDFCKLWAKTIAKERIYSNCKEHLVVYTLNGKMKVIGWHLVSVGAKNQTIAHIAEILRPAIIDNASGIVIMHNHPSGEPTPSMADRRITDDLNKACQLMSIRLHDHVIYTESQDYYSFQETGELH